MSDFLFRLSEPLVLGLAATALGLLVAGLIRLVNHLGLLDSSVATMDFALRIQATLFSVTALILVFTLVQADENFRKVDAAVADEAAHIDQLDRLLARFQTPDSREIRPLLLGYAGSVTSDDWAAMVSSDGGSAATEQAFAALTRHALGMRPDNARESAIFAEMLRVLDEIADARSHRLKTATLGLPAIYWQVVLFAVVMCMVLSCAVPYTRFRTLVMAVQAGVLGALVGFVFLMDHPYKGDTRVGPQPILEVMARMKARTE